MTAEQLALQLIRATPFADMRTIVNVLVARAEQGEREIGETLQLLDNAHAEQFGVGLLFALNNQRAIEIAGGN